MIREYSDRNGFELLEMYNDGQQTTGYSEDRPEYQKMLTRLDEGDIDHVVVRDRSRLARDSKDRLRLLLDLEEMNVDTHVVETGEVIDLSESYSRTREAAQADADDHEKRKEAERGRREIQRRQEKGLPVGPPPFGLQYSDSGDELVPDDNFDVAIEVLERRDAGESYRQIANAEGTPDSKDTVRRIVDRRDRYQKTEQPT